MKIAAKVKRNQSKHDRKMSNTEMENGREMTEKHDRKASNTEKTEQFMT